MANKANNLSVLTTSQPQSSSGLPDHVPAPPVDLDDEALSIWVDLFGFLKKEQMSQSGVDTVLALQWVMLNKTIRACYRGLAGKDIIDQSTGAEHPLSVVAGKKSVELLKVTTMLGLNHARKLKAERASR